MIKEAVFIREIGETADNMYRLGWNERNGGNISMYITREELVRYEGELSVKRKICLSTAFPELAGEHFIITGTGKYFRNILKAPAENLGIVRITDDGKAAELLWGYDDGGSFTSEITMHLGTHLIRRKIDPRHKVVIHAHPANLIAMTQIHIPDEREFTRSLWGIMTECIVIFPDGIGMLDWALSSSDTLGLKTAEKFADFRILVWAFHGITVAGSSLDEAFGLVETVEKAAEIYMKVAAANSGIRRCITPAALREVAEGFGLVTKSGWLDN